MTPVLSPDRLVTLWYRMSHRAFRLAWKILKPTTIGVKVIASDPEGRILLVRPRYVEAWMLPGGGVHKRETPEHAAARELFEETGLDVQHASMQLLGLLSNFAEGKSDYVAVYACNVPSGAQPLAANEIGDAIFLTIDALPDGTSSATVRRLTEYASGKPMTGVW